MISEGKSVPKFELMMLMETYLAQQIYEEKNMLSKYIPKTLPLAALLRLMNFPKIIKNFKKLVLIL